MEQSEDTVMDKSSPANEESSLSEPKIEAMSFESKDTVSKDPLPLTQSRRSMMSKREYNIYQKLTSACKLDFNKSCISWDQYGDLLELTQGFMMSSNFAS
jgi:hypothetical protein